MRRRTWIALCFFVAATTRIVCSGFPSPTCSSGLPTPVVAGTVENESGVATHAIARDGGHGHDAPPKVLDSHGADADGAAADVGLEEAVGASLPHAAVL
jgi:hypothetical protein